MTSFITTIKPELATPSEQRPPVNNGHYFWVPCVIVVLRFDYFYILDHIKTYIIIINYIIYLLFDTYRKSIDFRPSSMEIDSLSIESPSQNVVKNPLINEGKVTI